MTEEECGQLEVAQFKVAVADGHLREDLSHTMCDSCDLWGLVKVACEVEPIYQMEDQQAQEKREKKEKKMRKALKKHVKWLRTLESGNRPDQERSTQPSCGRPQRGAGGTFKGRCYRCGERGHRQSECSYSPEDYRPADRRRTTKGKKARKRPSSHLN